ncbi:hypothetical protein BG004_001629 [Podila humilis]|nr:hypothetical protein BG004_001629 [Podila humilis]
MGSAVIPLFKQLGMYEEFMERSKPCDTMTMFTEELEVIHTMRSPFIKTYTNYSERIISRPELYTILRGNIPSHQVVTGKRVPSFTQDDNGVNVRCADNSLYYADMIVGADGAYSAIRQKMYSDPEVAPTLSPADKAHCRSNWVTATTAQDTVCWMVIHFMDKDSYKRNDSFRTTEWGPESAEAYAREVRDFKVPGGRNGNVLTLGDYLDKTPARHLSKVVLEEIVFEK